MQVNLSNSTHKLFSRFSFFHSMEQSVVVVIYDFVVYLSDQSAIRARLVVKPAARRKCQGGQIYLQGRREIFGQNWFKRITTTLFEMFTLPSRFLLPVSKAKSSKVLYNLQ